MDRLKCVICAVLVGVMIAITLGLLTVNLQLRKSIRELSNKKDSEYAYKLDKEINAIKTDFSRKTPLK